jgi:hypothetical protein
VHVVLNTAGAGSRRADQDRNGSRLIETLRRSAQASERHQLKISSNRFSERLEL